MVVLDKAEKKVKTPENAQANKKKEKKTPSQKRRKRRDDTLARLLKKAKIASEDEIMKFLSLTMRGKIKDYGVMEPSVELRIKAAKELAVMVKERNLELPSDSEVKDKEDTQSLINEVKKIPKSILEEKEEEVEQEDGDHNV